AHRTNVAQHLVDGEETFAVMFEHLGRATRQIFITGWWISPHYALVRTSAQARLDSELYTVLRAAAARGVQVFVLVYREHHLVLPNDSKFAKESLQGANIHVLRHPDFVVIPQFWSHHEKIVCIDQTVAFVGGLDIALGRFDAPAHLLTDIGAMPTWTGQDYSNPRLKDFVDVQHIQEPLIDRATVPRMPWHDIHCRYELSNIARHFIHRWNFTVQKKYTVLVNRTRQRRRRSEIPAILPYTHQPRTTSEGGDVVHCQVVRSLSPWSGGVKTEKSIQQAYMDTIAAAKHFIYIEASNQFFVSGFDLDASVANRVVEALYARITDAHAKQETFRVMFIMPLLPCFEGAVTGADSANLRAVMHWQMDLVDPTSDASWHQIRRLAHTNTDIYERVFQCFPTDKFPSYFHAVPEAHLHEDIRVVYENQRYAWGSGWSSEHLVFGERTEWSDAFGLPFDSFTPSSSWEVDMSDASCDDQGWQYAFSFKSFQKDKGAQRAVPLWYRWRDADRHDEAPVDLRQFLRRSSSRMVSTRNLNTSAPPQQGGGWVPPEVEELSHVQGQLVEFPLQFLRDCDLRPLILPKNLFI
ncbi:hypothetical protein DYB36_009904, partial [Aphanomyces astaci]